MGLDTNYRITPTFRWLGNNPDKDNELFLTVCGIEKCKPDKSYGPTIRDDYHIHFVLKGKGTFKINNISYPVHSEQIFMVPPDIETFYYADPSDPWEYTWVSFSGVKASYYLEKAGLTLKSPVRNTYIDPKNFLALTEDILDHHELTTVNELTRTSLLYQIVSLLIKSYNLENKKSGGRDIHDYSPGVYVEHAIKYIHFNYKKLTVSEVADYIGITRSYLTHVFKEKLNISPQEYIITYRLEQGCRLLRSTNLSIQAISEEIGYTDPLTFSKIFKIHYGISPKKYRQSSPAN